MQTAPTQPQAAPFALNAPLEQQLRERTAELEAARAELEAFAYSISHDLRAPLRSIVGFAKVIEEDYADRVDAEGRDALRRVRTAARKMAEQLDDMLKLSRVSRSELTREPVDLGKLARAIAAELAAAEPRPGVVFDVAPGLVAWGDRRLLALLLRNLLGNAWKFTSAHASARIEIGVTNAAGEPAYFVRDNGAGFDMADASRLFTPFQRLHGIAEFPGTGIGLAIVRCIVQRHGGRIWAEGAVQNGATFYFTLPGARIEMQAPVREAALT